MIKNKTKSVNNQQLVLTLLYFLNQLNTLVFEKPHLLVTFFVEKFSFVNSFKYKTLFLKGFFEPVKIMKVFMCIQCLDKKNKTHFFNN